MLLLYGATGYTGQLILTECLARGIRPIVAGRNADALRALAAPHGLEVRAFDLRGDIPLQGVQAVLHAAGPFFRTSRPMVAACLAQRVHYLDITGEIAVFEACRAQHDAARAAGIVLLPGTGFDVVPTDCLAARLAEALPDASLLELAFAGGGGFSRGTLKTMLLGAGEGGAIRSGGRITRVPAAWRTQRIPFRDKARDAITIPWGDVSTAHWSTGIPDIHTYLAMPRRAQRAVRLQRLLAPLLRTRVARRWLERRADAVPPGPGAEVRATARMQVWGRVTHADGRVLEGTAVVPEGYRFTAMAAVTCAHRVLTAAPAAGYHTPSSAFGAEFLETLPECDVALGATHTAPPP
ncbi:MAG: saccharopine dehydrogenase NADP-binding domain-containing protein [Gemmatimonadetes bacterium]|nr:saccharopine dehydrogenase NADP-binding domain-containing protein [Gemmatimonadota bacterium]